MRCSERRRRASYPTARISTSRTKIPIYHKWKGLSEFIWEAGVRYLGTVLHSSINACFRTYIRLRSCHCCRTHCVSVVSPQPWNHHGICCDHFVWAWRENAMMLLRHEAVL